MKKSLIDNENKDEHCHAEELSKFYESKYIQAQEIILKLEREFEELKNKKPSNEDSNILFFRNILIIEYIVIEKSIFGNNNEETSPVYLSPSHMERNLRIQLLNDLENKIMRESISSAESEERYIRVLEKEIESIKRENIRLMEDLEQIRTNIMNYQEKMQKLKKNMTDTKIELCFIKEEKEFLVAKNDELYQDLIKKKQLISEFEKKVSPNCESFLDNDKLV